jgi:glycosyltransferase involved in cell wall biosynthesis
LRIVVVNYEYPPLGGGGGVLTRTLVASLARSHEVTVVTSRAPGLPAESFDDGAHILRVPVLGRRRLEKASLASLLTFVPAARRASWVAERGGVDVVHSFFAVPSGPAGAALAGRAGSPHLLTLIGADVHDPSRRISPENFPPLRNTVRRVVRSADGVTAISRDVAGRAARLTGRADIEVVHCAVGARALPAPDRRSLGWGRDEVVVLTVARLVPRKGLDSLVRAVGRAGAPLRLEVVGDGPERGALEAAAADAGARVAFAGAQDAAGVALRLASADAFALVSLHEGFGLVYLEAMLAGLPVVAGDTGGQTDFLRDGVNALLVPPGDESAIAGALRRLAGDRRLRANFAEAGRRTAAGYTPERMTSEYLEAYERARDARRPAR